METSTLNNEPKLSQKEKLLLQQGFELIEADDKSCHWLEKQLNNPFIKNCHIAVEVDGNISIWGNEPKEFGGQSGIVMISACGYSDENLKALIKYFNIDGPDDKEVRK